MTNEDRIAIATVINGAFLATGWSINGGIVLVDSYGHIEEFPLSDILRESERYGKFETDAHIATFLRHPTSVKD